MKPEADGLSIQTKAFVGVTASLGVVVLGYACLHWQSQDLMRFVCYLAVAVLASGLKVQLPGIDGTMSVNFLFILLGVLELSLPETLLIGCTASLVQSVWQTRKRLDPSQSAVQRSRHDGQCQRAHLPQLSLAVARFGSNKPILLMVAALGLLLRQHASHLRRNRAHRGQIEPQSLVGVLLLVVPLLPGRCRRGWTGRHREPVRGMGNVPARAAPDLLGVSLVPACIWAGWRLKKSGSKSRSGTSNKSRR